MIDERATRNWLGTDGFVRSQIRPGVDFEVADSVAALDATRALAPAVPAGVLVDCRAVRTASRASRQYFDGPEAKRTLAAMAILVASPVSRMIASFFIRLVRPGFRVKIFVSEAAAVAWLREPGP